MMNTYLFKFPQSKETTQVTCSPFSVRKIAAKFLKEQCELKGCVCYVCNYSDEEVVAVVFLNESNKIKFFIEDDSEEQVRTIIE